MLIAEIGKPISTYLRDSFDNVLFVGDTVEVNGYSSIRSYDHVKAEIIESDSITKDGNYFGIRGWYSSGIKGFLKERPKVTIKKIAGYPGKTDMFAKKTYHVYEKAMDNPLETNVYKIIDGNRVFLVKQPLAISEGYTVTYDGLKTVVVLKSGAKGTAKCEPDDVWSQQIGHDLALNRARIAKLKAEIEITLSKSVKKTNTKKAALEGQIKDMELKLTEMKKEITSL